MSARASPGAGSRSSAQRTRSRFQASKTWVWRSAVIGSAVMRRSEQRAVQSLELRGGGIPFPAVPGAARRPSREGSAPSRVEQKLGGGGGDRSAIVGEDQ